LLSILVGNSRACTECRSATKRKARTRIVRIENIPSTGAITPVPGKQKGENVVIANSE